jgi:hypothetical protein
MVPVPTRYEVRMIVIVAFVIDCWYLDTAI